MQRAVILDHSCPLHGFQAGDTCAACARNGITQSVRTAAPDGARPVALSQVKPGEYVRRKADAKTTFKRGAYDRATRSYALCDCEDINRIVYVKATALVYLGFTY